MSERNTIRARRLPDGTTVQVFPDGSTRPLERQTDWTYFDSLTEDEIEANALADPDNPPISDEELTHFRHVPNPRAIRERLGLSQEQFAERFSTGLARVQEWESGMRHLDATATTLLRVIDKHPEAVLDVLWGEARVRQAG